MSLELARVANVPDMVANSIVVSIGDIQLSTRNPFRHLNRFEHRAVAVPATSSIIHLAGSGRLAVVPEHIHQVVGMNVVANLLPLVTENGVRGAGDDALH